MVAAGKVAVLCRENVGAGDRGTMAVMRCGGSGGRRPSKVCPATPTSQIDIRVCVGFHVIYLFFLNG